MSQMKKDTILQVCLEKCVYHGKHHLFLSKMVFFVVTEALDLKIAQYVESAFIQFKYHESQYDGSFS